MPLLPLSLLLSLVLTAILALLGCRPYDDDFQSPLRRLIAFTLFVGILAVAVCLPVASYGEVGALSASELHLADLLSGHVLLVAFLVLWWWLRRDQSLTEFLHLSTRQLPTQIARGLATGVNGWVLTILVMLTVGSLASSMGALDTPEVADSVPEIMSWMARLPWAQKLAIVFTAMSVEEAFFRGFLQPRIGLLGSSVLFALGHFSYGNPMMIVGVFTISMFIGRSFVRDQQLLPCMLAHGVFDAVQIFLILPYAVKMLEQTPLLPA